jgi:hypothetical protein
VAEFGKRFPEHMPYGLIVLVLVVALAGVYVFAAEVSFWSKALVAGLLLLSFAWRYGLFLRVALGVFLALYFACLKARSEGPS